MPGGSGRYRAALKGFMARQISVLVWAFRARGALFDSKSLCPIAQHGLLQEPWAHKGRLPSCALRTEAHCLPAKHAIKSGARTQISALAHPSGRRTATPLGCGSATPAARRRLAPNSAQTLLAPGAEIPVGTPKRSPAAPPASSTTAGQLEHVRAGGRGT